MEKQKNVNSKEEKNSNNPTNRVETVRNYFGKYTLDSNSEIRTEMGKKACATRPERQKESNQEKEETKAPTLKR